MTTTDFLKTIEYFGTLSLILYVPYRILTLGETEEYIGREAVNRNLRLTMRYALVGALIGYPSRFMFSNLDSFIGDYRGVSFNIFMAGVITTWTAIWIYSKGTKKFGNLLFNMGRPPLNKDCFWIGINCLVIVSSETWRFYLELPTDVKQSVLKGIGELGLLWILTILLLTYGLSGIEFREKGICFMFVFLNWKRINNYNWEKSKSNILTLWFDPYFPLVQEHLTINIPKKDKDVISEILDEQLPGKKREV